MSVGALGVAWGRKDTGIIPISLICISQVISAVKPHLPYNTRIKELSKIIGQYDYMFNELENYYNCINNKTDDMIMQELNKYKRIRSDFQHNCLPNDTLPYNKKFVDKALKYANNYFDI